MKAVRPILMALSVLVCGCDNSKPNEKGFPVGTATEDGEFAVRINGSPWFFRYVEVDGHEYLMMHGSYRSGITHSPNCKCLKEREDPRDIFGKSVATRYFPDSKARKEKDAELKREEAKKAAERKKDLQELRELAEKLGIEIPEEAK